MQWCHRNCPGISPYKYIINLHKSTLTCCKVNETSITLLFSKSNIVDACIANNVVFCLNEHDLLMIYDMDGDFMHQFNC